MQVIQPFFCDVVERVGASQEEKLCNAGKHFQEFLGDTVKIKDLKIPDITFKLLGKFGDYLLLVQGDLVLKNKN